MPRVLHETKHFQATARIRALANALEPGENLPVASDLMKTLEISHGTAIRALKVLADEGVIVRAMGRQRYHIAERFERISGRISMVRPDFPSRELDSMVQSVYNAGQQRNWKFNQHCYRNPAEVDFGRIMGESDGMIFLPTAEFISGSLARALLKPARPVVVLLQHLRHAQINNVCVNDFRVGELAAETLFERGHRRILFLKDQPDESTMAERYRGFSSAAKRLGIPYGGELLLETGLHSFENPEERCYRILNRLFDGGKPDFTAVFAASMTGGMVMLRVCREHGIEVPRHMAVLSFGGEANLAPYFYPPLSCIEIELDKLGEYSAQILDDMLSPGETQPYQIVIEPKFVLRESI